MPEASAERATLLRAVNTLEDYAVVLLDPDGRVMSWNAGAERILGYGRDEIIGTHFEVFLTDEDRSAGLADEELRTVSERGSYEEEGWRVRKDGSRIWAHVTTMPVLDEAGALQALSKVMRDVTERRRAEEALRERADELERMAHERGQLVAQALAAEDRERRRLAEALHDNALQTLLAVRQDLRSAQRSASGSNGIERAIDGIDTTVRQLRNLALEVHPLLLERKGLSTALEAIAHGAASLGGFACTVRVDEEVAGRADRTDRLLLSVARELLLNAAKHSGAERVSVVIEREGDGIMLEVIDDGGGVAAGRRERALSEGHLGLASTEERVKAAGGSFALEGRAEGGTVARATFAGPDSD